MQVLCHMRANSENLVESGENVIMCWKWSIKFGANSASGCMHQVIQTFVAVIRYPKTASPGHSQCFVQFTVPFIEVLVIHFQIFYLLLEAYGSIWVTQQTNQSKTYLHQQFADGIQLDFKGNKCFFYLGGLSSYQFLVSRLLSVIQTRQNAVSMLAGRAGPEDT